jgi:TRAP-type C4-dicarboxylate transport system permease small subunit
VVGDLRAGDCQYPLTDEESAGGANARRLAAPAVIFNRVVFDAREPGMHRFNKLTDYAAIAFFTAILVLVNVQIVCRFVLSISVPWTEEVSRLIFIWLAFLGAAIGLREGSLIVIDTLPEMLGPRFRAWLSPLVRICSLAVIVFLFGASIPLVRSVWPTTLATVDWISNGWAYVAFTASFGLMLIYSVAPMVSRALARRA